jgi:tetraacyldisaccharide 4'-kinase
MIAKFRAWFYQRSLLKVTKLPAFVVSVGNLSMGGTGKSPFVMLLAEKAVAAGLRTAVLTRGYKRESNEVVIVGPNEKIPPVEKIGDEPWMIKNRVPGISLLVHADRGLKAAELWQELGSPELVILDDGFQHWKLARDRDVVMVDATEPLHGAALPFGKMREEASALGRADLVVVTRSAGLESRERQFLLGQISAAVEKRISAPWKKTTTARAAVLWADYQFSGFKDIRDGSSLGSVKGREFVLVTGIAKPAGFTRMAQSLGINIREEIYFPDHHPLSAVDRDKILAAVARLNGGSILLSEKDFARWGKIVKDIPGVSVEVRFQFCGEGAPSLDHFCDSIFAEARRCSISG